MSEELKQREPYLVMMSAHALCPTDMAHPDRMRWMAKYFMEHSATSSTIPASEAGELPPLPKPECLVVGVYGYRESHMRAYGKECARAALTSTRTASDTRTAGLEAAAKLCDAADKSEHPSDLADRIRALAAGKVECEQKAPSEFSMAGYDIACRYGVMEARAFCLADEMFAAFKAIEPPASLASDEEFCDANCVWTNHAPGCVRSTPSAQMSAREALQAIHDTFKRDLDQGYKTRDKEFAVAISEEALSCTASTDAATRSRAEGGNTCDCAKFGKDCAAIAAEIDVEAERKLFEAWASSEQFDLRRPNKTYRNTCTSYAWQGWLAARTQADAGKAGAAAHSAEGE